MITTAYLLMKADRAQYCLGNDTSPNTFMQPFRFATEEWAHAIMAMQFYTIHQSWNGNKYEVSFTHQTQQGHAFLFYSDILIDKKEDADTIAALTTPQKHDKAKIQDIIPNTMGRIPCKKEEEPSGSH